MLVQEIVVATSTILVKSQGLDKYTSMLISDNFLLNLTHKIFDTSCHILFHRNQNKSVTNTVTIASSLLK